MASFDPFDSISPLDYRYYGRNKDLFTKIQPFLSETAAVQYQAKVEVALAKVLAQRGICTKKIADEIAQAAQHVKPEEVYAEEDRIKHNIRALVNCIRKNVSDEAKPYVHFSTTSHDIICSADAARFKDFIVQSLIPELNQLNHTLIALSRREKATLQIGRTHGQHAEPITFGFAMAQYVARIGHKIQDISVSAKDLRGKIAGAVGGYNALSLFVNDPEAFEKEVLLELGIPPSPISTQVVAAEYLTDAIHDVVSCFGILANLADDLRHLQRSEIAEVGESFGKEQVGSSTMPHKRNPISFENVKSLWKATMPRMMTVYLDQISEHQRDLTNSASSRFVPEILATLLIAANRMKKAIEKLSVDRSSLQHNFDQSKDMIAAEPLYLLLAAHHHPDAHEKVRQVTLIAQQKKRPFQDLALADKELAPYLKKFSKQQLDLVKHPEKYVGICAQKTEKICKQWD
ncbi:adenylosuccinate lyase [Candidatus Woesearchaeota archaeon]|nr:adenylosuccinate lyase [Candidatus Woesearchaeota archaeon]